ncbi:low temperature requirement protein A [Amycolatopsis suaedae]|uniref:Low temperature requirement protein A n=1 Tax=Amycolatopsis suaedae TaxID=2510978 RepID=A0A4Q7J879_9PSEU|nr:low temperature requirement protein A [Amycolatopsis suaedae]RZQ63032.1 low temperature requirement protein A [Amycolatopsis suaedae]
MTQIRSWYRPMRARPGDEPHRVATSLELLYDLCFVVAVGRTAIEFHHALSENHVLQGLAGFLFVFWAIWWPWLQFSWFASSYDTDDVPYRLAVLVQIAGGLVIAAGVPGAFHGDFRVVVIGYVLMRLAAVTQWLRAARSDPARRVTALRYAGGITVVQVLWIARLWLPDSLLVPSVLVLFLVELAVPVWAERAAGTTWHPHHIAERYGLFTIIVLGETVIGATAAVQEGIAETEALAELIGLAGCGLVIVFAMWWLYFDRPGHARLTSLPAAIRWGYGHYLIFASAAAVGSGIEVAVDHHLHKTTLPMFAVGLAVTVPVAIFVLSVWLLQIGPRDECRPLAVGFPAAAVLAVAVSFTPIPIHLVAVVLAALVVTTVVATEGHTVERTHS